jgi:PAS domain S-box-containing protein
MRPNHREELFQEARLAANRRTDQLFARLMLLQWAAAALVSLSISPLSWAIDGQLFIAVCLGALITLPPVWLARRHPGKRLTRHAMAVSQLGWSALLIHLTGGRVETHFHLFASLALLAFYRDRAVLVTAALVAAAVHLLGAFWPVPVYGIAHPEPLHLGEHAAWMLFEIAFLIVGIRESLRRQLESAERQAKAEGFTAAAERQLEERTRELLESREQLRALVESTQAVPWKMSVAHQFSSVGSHCVRLLGCDARQWLEPGFLEERLHPLDAERVIEELGMMRTNGGEQEIEFRLRREDGGWTWLRGLVVGARGELRGFLLDITERQRLSLELQDARHLESVGRLAAGIAHEINTPLQTMADNLFWARERILDIHRELPQALEIATALTDSSAALSRISEIVRSMRDFARPEKEETGWADLNHALAATLNVAASTFDGAVDVQTRFSPLPLVACRLSVLNQAFLAVLENAGAAIRATGKRGILCVVTRPQRDGVEISISDNGVGMTDEVQRRVFDPFFTTREVGGGMGQGLTLARNAIVGAHGGSITVNSKPGAGTIVLIRIPIAGPAAEVV